MKAALIRGRFEKKADMWLGHGLCKTCIKFSILIYVVLRVMYQLLNYWYIVDVILMSSDVWA